MIRSNCESESSELDSKSMDVRNEGERTRIYRREGGLCQAMVTLKSHE